MLLWLWIWVIYCDMELTSKYSVVYCFLFNVKTIQFPYNFLLNEKEKILNLILKAHANKYIHFQVSIFIMQNIYLVAFRQKAEKKKKFLSRYKYNCCNIIVSFSFNIVQLFILQICNCSLSLFVTRLFWVISIFTFSIECKNKSNRLNWYMQIEDDWKCVLTAHSTHIN